MTRPKMLAAICAFILVPILAPGRAYAADTFNRSAAVAYADRWVQDCSAANNACGSGILRNPDFYSFGNDCTNYVSQVWNAAGVLERYWASPYWYGKRARNGYVTSWTTVDIFGSYMVDRFKIASYRMANLSNPYNPAYGGDAILYDLGWGRWGHAAVEVNYSGEYYWHGQRYEGDYVNQHTQDREHSPWNLGWLAQKDMNVKQNWRAVVVHFNG